MKIQGSTALVTGANRGLGAAIVTALLRAGAKKVYAAARERFDITDPRVEYVRLDVTSAADVAAAAFLCDDVDLLINNAGISRFKSFLSEDSIAAARSELETNFIAPLALTQAFAPVLASNGGGAVVNVLSVVSWVNVSAFATYSASKAAAWSLTNGLRNELRSQGTHVLGVHVGFMDTDMARNIPSAKTSPDDVAQRVVDALENSSEEVLVDEISQQVRHGLSAEPPVYLLPR